MHIQLGHFL